jgi:hypothetical protein
MAARKEPKAQYAGFRRVKGLEPIIVVRFVKDGGSNSVEWAEMKEARAYRSIANRMGGERG